MRFDAVLLRALGLFALLGIVLFAGKPAPSGSRGDAQPPHTEPKPAPVVTVAHEPPDPVTVGVAEIVKRIPIVSPAALPIESAPPPPEPKLQLDKLPDLPPTLTAGRKAALRAVLAGDPYLLYFGAPPGTMPWQDEGAETLIEVGVRRLAVSGKLRHESIGDSVDPQLAEFVHDFNLQILHAQRSNLIRTRLLRGLWSAVALLDPKADDLLFDLLDDPTDAIATAYDPEAGACELDLGKKDGIRKGMRFVLWTQERPLRRVLALAEVDHVMQFAQRCRVRIIKSFSDSWPAAPGIRASNPFFHRGRSIAGYVLSDNLDRHKARFQAWPHASIYDSLQFPAFCIVGDVPDAPRAFDPRLGRQQDPRDMVFDEQLERAKNSGAIFVPERLVPYLLPAR